MGTCIFLLNACGFIGNNHATNDPQTQNLNDDNTNQTQQQITPVQPNQVHAEIPFDEVSFVPFKFKPRSQGGIFIYTKEAHPGNISETFKRYWDEYDMLYIQLGEQFKGYEIELMALEKKDAKTARLVLRVNTTNKAGNPTADPARKFIRVPKGSLNGYSFEVVDETGRALSLQ